VSFEKKTCKKKLGVGGGEEFDAFLSFTLPFFLFFLNASIAPTCTATIIPLGPCALNVEIHSAFHIEFHPFSGP